MQKFIIKVGARSSPLSIIQAQEVLNELQEYHPDVDFELIPIRTKGDKDKATSLRDLNKTDFFTREIDQLLLKGGCRIGIHSAKDLPEPLPKGLRLVALTKGVDSSDSLVIPQGMTLNTLPSYARIATSSTRREEIVKTMRRDLTFLDIRGNIQERLEKLRKHEIEGLVIAEAAVIRLNLKHLNRIPLPGPTTLFQGRLAVLAREDDLEMVELFKPIHKKTILHTGLEAHPSLYEDAMLVHTPLIKICPLPFKILKIDHITHFIFTSKSAVNLFFISHPKNSLVDKTCMAVGTATAAILEKYGVKNILVASDQRAEGIISLLETLNLEEAHVLWPHGAKARPLISEYLIQRGVPFQEAILYDTLPEIPDPKVDINLIDEIIFTSPSTVKSFMQFYGRPPQDKVLTPIGSVTHEYIQKVIAG